MPDFKFWERETAARYAKAADYPERAKEAIKEMHRQVFEIICSWVCCVVRAYCADGDGGRQRAQKTLDTRAAPKKHKNQKGRRPRLCARRPRQARPATAPFGDARPRRRGARHFGVGGGQAGRRHVCQPHGAGVCVCAGCGCGCVWVGGGGQGGGRRFGAAAATAADALPRSPQHIIPTPVPLILSQSTTPTT